MSLLCVMPLGSKRTCSNLRTRDSTGTPYWRLTETRVAMQSIRPPMVLPSLAMVMKTSPGAPSWYRPTVMYPSWPATSNLWVRALRVSGRRRRRGRSTMRSMIFSMVCGAGVRLLEARFCVCRATAAAIELVGLEPKLPGEVLAALDLLDRRVVGEIDGLGNRPADKRLGRGHH